MAKLAALTVKVTELEGVRKLLAELAVLHRRSDGTVEIEVWHDAEDPDCDDRDSRYREYQGHLRHIHVCDQCGVGFDVDGDGPVWLEWPCRTARLLELQ